MATESVIVSDSVNDVAGIPTKDLSTPRGGGKELITLAERWALICENVYARAQRRCFLGGDPLQDLVAAEQEIDDAYEADYNCVFSLTSIADITEQLRSLFAGYGCNRDHLEHLLSGHQEALERLAAANRESLESSEVQMDQRIQLLEDIACEAKETLLSLAQGQLQPEGVFDIAETSMRAIDNALAAYQLSLRSASAVSEDGSDTETGGALSANGLANDCQSRSARRLLDAPVAALEGISECQAECLQEVFGVETVGDLGTHPLFNAARSIVELAESED